MDQIRKFRRPIFGAGRQLLPLLGGLSRHLEGYGAGDSRTEPARERFEKREAQQRHASIKDANRDAKSPVPLVFILFGSSLQSQRPRKGVVWDPVVKGLHYVQVLLSHQTGGDSLCFASSAPTCLAQVLLTLPASRAFA